MTTTPTRRPFGLAIVLILTGFGGLWASFSLTNDKFLVLQDPNAVLDCNISLFVECATNLQSWQGAIFGFPNPLLGLMGFVAPIAVGVAVLAGARFQRWFWVLFNIGVAGALALCIWLMTQTFGVIGKICLWCVLTWIVTIIMFWALTLFNVKEGSIPIPGKAAKGLYAWTPLFVIVSFVIVLIVAQVQLDLLSYL